MVKNPSVLRVCLALRFQEAIFRLHNADSPKVSDLGAQGHTAETRAS